MFSRSRTKMDCRRNWRRDDHGEKDQKHVEMMQPIHTTVVIIIIIKQLYNNYFIVIIPGELESGRVGEWSALRGRMLGEQT